MTDADEYVVPNCAALMEPGRSCFTFLNVPSHACKLTFDLYKTVLHGTIKIEPPFSTDLFPPQAQDTALSASDSCQHLKIGDPRITQNVDKQPVGVREQGQGMGQQAKALAVPPKSLFDQQAQQTTSYRSKTQGTKRHCHVSDTAWRPPQTQATPQTQKHTNKVPEAHVHLPKNRKRAPRQIDPCAEKYSEIMVKISTQ